MNAIYNNRHQLMQVLSNISSNSKYLFLDNRMPHDDEIPGSDIVHYPRAFTAAVILTNALRANDHMTEFSSNFTFSAQSVD